MRRLAVIGLVVASCTNSTATTTTIDLLPPPPNPDGPTTTEPAPATTSTPELTTQIEGAFPDGTPYTVSMTGDVPEVVISISGTFLFDSEDGPVSPVAEMLISRAPIDGYSIDESVYRVPGGGGGSFVISFLPYILTEIGEDAAGVIQSSIKGNSRNDMPILILREPFRWETPEEEVVPMEVAYTSFVVRKGCDERAVACTDSRGAQVIPLDRVKSPAPPFEGENVIINSPAPRLRTDPNYLDRGPFTNLDSPNVFWTGREMIVWGGTSISRGNPQQQGAAYDPQTNQWRLFDGPGLTQGTPSLGLWANDEMWVVTPFGTYVGDLVEDTWTEIGTGISLIEPFNPHVVVGHEVFVWSDIGLFTFEDGQWSELPNPGFGGDDPHAGDLLDFGGNLVATGTSGRSCASRETAIWTGITWTGLGSIPMPRAACSGANQSAVVGGELLYWGDGLLPTYRFDAGLLDWVQDDPVPLEDGGGIAGGLVLGHRLLVPAPSGAAIYDPTSRSWTEVELPGFAWSDQMVWTGTEVLAWVGYGNDAWRWTPPE